MSKQQFTDRDERFIRRYQYGDDWVVAVDVGASDDAVDVDVDVVGTTAIVVVANEEGVSELEFELPDDASSITTNNGVLIIRG
jgi:HSP20 family molecular chaperone IbpA